MSEETELHPIRDWVGRGIEYGLLGAIDSSAYPGQQIKSFWIGSSVFVGSLHPDNSRMAVSIENYRHATSAGTREIVRRFDELVAKHFPQRKKLVRRSAVEEIVAQADAAPGGLLDTVAAEIAERIMKQPPPQKMSAAEQLDQAQKNSAAIQGTTSTGRKRLLPPDERGGKS